MLLGPRRVPAVRLYVFGESFMFNMIRHMVGMAVAVARGVLPARYVPASLSSSALCTYVHPQTTPEPLRSAA
jgi:tRNA U38,U39,U40 pseudouridine synthase TruA